MRRSFYYAIAMNCPTCQAAVPDRANFCPNGGAAVGQPLTLGFGRTQNVRMDTVPVLTTTNRKPKAQRRRAASAQ
ncbi:MAG TPA: hypothetical protein VJP85_10495 [Candidatus Baltobacteraceae bacterium]|nr:hypothetical protein [Candidatus Baltobacteraceae bacterium]